MKKFAFSLQKLLRYKEQVFDVERAVLVEMNAVLQTMEQQRDELEEELRQRSAEFNRQAAAGTTILEIQTHKTYLIRVDEEIRQKRAQIAMQIEAIDRQKDKVREAKIEISTMEKLKERKLEEYRYLENKAEEQFIEEFVSNTKATANA